MIDQNTLVYAELKAIQAKLSVYAGTTDNFELHKQLKKVGEELQAACDIMTLEKAKKSS